MVHVLFNFNSYLGGGETLLVRMVENILSDDFNVSELEVIASNNSYIYKSLTNLDSQELTLHAYSGSYDFFYLSEIERGSLINWLDVNLKRHTNINIVTFCMRDLHIAHELSRLREGVKVNHLLLHPLDHLFMCQSVSDKLRLFFYREARYSLKHNMNVNYALLKSLNDSESLIPMNANVLDRLKSDTSIQVDRANIIPLPIVSSEHNFNYTIPNLAKTKKKIVWLGRIVNFKIPAIKAMIDFVSDESDFSFDIIGYGEIDLILNYIKVKKCENKVKILEPVPYDSLKFELNKYDIGYAMGTSMVDLTLCGLPVIVALASPNYKSFPDAVCAGLVIDQSEGNVGDDLYSNSASFESLPKICDCVNTILDGESDIVMRSIEYVNNNFSIKKNIFRYLNVFNQDTAQILKCNENMKVNLLRKVLFHCVFFYKKVIFRVKNERH